MNLARVYATGAAALLAAGAAPAAPPISAPVVGTAASALFDRCAAVERVAGRSPISGEYLVSDTVDDCGGRLGALQRVAGDAPWRWASVTKQIVAVAAMQQVEAGTLALDTPVVAYVPKLGIANADRITLRMLLQHTSGLPNVEDGPADAKQEMLVQYRRDAATPPPGISPICRGAAKREPGARFEYDNCDTEVVGAVLEAVTHTPLADLLAAKIFVPAGMTATHLLKPGEASGRVGYFADGRDDGFVDVGRFGAAGAIAGPPGDLARFDRALMADRLLKPASRAEMERGDPKIGYVALGVWSYAVPLKGCTAPVKLVERRGDIGGVQVRNVIAYDRGVALIVFTDRPFDFGEAWQGKGGSFDLFSAAFCAEVPR